MDLTIGLFDGDREIDWPQYQRMPLGKCVTVNKRWTNRDGISFQGLPESVGRKFFWIDRVRLFADDVAVDCIQLVTPMCVGRADVCRFPPWSIVLNRNPNRNRRRRG